MVLPRIITESIEWLQQALKVRCRKAHSGSSQDSTQLSSSGTTLQLTSFHRMAEDKALINLT